MSQYRHINLSQNPFGSQSWEERGAQAVPRIPLAPLVDQLKRPGQTIQFLGRPGSGKSTHLAVLHRYFPDAPYLFVRDRKPIDLPSEPIMFIDESQRIPLTQRWQMWRSPATFVLTTHWHHGPEFLLAGRAFTSNRLGGLSPSHLVKMVNKRFEAVRMSPSDPIPRLSAQTAQRYISLHKENIRAIFNELYDDVEKLESVQPL